MSAKMPAEMSDIARELRERVLRELGPKEPTHKTLKEMMDEEWARRAALAKTES